MSDDDGKRVSLIHRRDVNRDDPGDRLGPDIASLGDYRKALFHRRATTEIPQ
jgi:hypothetical protein